MVLLQLLLFLEVFTKRNFVADFIRLNSNLIHKNDKFAFLATLWGVRGNVHSSSIARWKARGRFAIRCIEHFSLALMFEPL